MDIEEFFKESPIEDRIIDKNEYFEKSQKILGSISMEYSKSWISKTLNDSEYPDESVCNSCKGCGVFKNSNLENIECFQDKEYGECYYRFFDSEEFGNSIETLIEAIDTLLGYNKII